MPILGRLLHQNFRKLENKHELLKSEEAQLLKSLQVSKDELYTFAKLVNDSSKGTINNDLLNVLGEKRRRTCTTRLRLFHGGKVQGGCHQGLFSGTHTH